MSQLHKNYAVEICNPGLFGPRYSRHARTASLGPYVYPLVLLRPLAEQHRRIERLTAPFTVLRLLTPLNMSYGAAKKRAEPYTKIVEELPQMRRDTVDLVKRAVGESRRAYILVNNRSEGNAPLTVQALSEMLRD